ncbi:hypothetical protein ACJ41O_006951 [Fusarium nematophilum]
MRVSGIFATLASVAFVANANPCKPSTTTTAIEIASTTTTTTATTTSTETPCVPQGTVCGVRGNAANTDTFLGFQIGFSVEECKALCAIKPGCNAFWFTFGYCGLFGGSFADLEFTPGSNGAAWYQMECFCD